MPGESSHIAVPRAQRKCDSSRCLGSQKTHLISALVHEACVSGYTAGFLSSTSIMETFTHARAQNRLKRKLMGLKKPHVLVIDEVGYENYTAEQPNLFFQLINSRYEHGSIMITNNKPFGKMVGNYVRRCYRYRDTGSSSASCTCGLPQGGLVPYEGQDEIGSR